MGKKNKRTSLSVMFIICAVTVVILYITGIGCIFKYVTGISCPACGMTRAYMSLLNMEIMSAFEYHPLFFMAPFICIYMIDEIRIKIFGKYERKATVVMYVVAIVFIIVYLVRLFEVKDSIVEIDVKNGLVYRMFTWMKCKYLT